MLLVMTAESIPPAITPTLPTKQSQPPVALLATTVAPEKSIPRQGKLLVEPEPEPVSPEREGLSRLWLRSSIEPLRSLCD